MIAAWVDGLPATSLPLTDRSLHYGDGVFTTIRVHAGRACWLPEQLQRLSRDAARLGLPAPDAELLASELATAAAQPGVGVLKVMLTRGSGPRGYSAPGCQGRRLLFAYVPIVDDPARYREGVRLRRCDLLLSESMALAGIKHLNRLEQVLARAEWDDPSIDEGLLCNQANQVIAATAANVFARFGDRWVTPPVDRCGVAGLCREAILALPQALPVARVAQLAYADCLRADELWLSNALRGIVPVAWLGDHRYTEFEAARGLMRVLHPQLGLPVID